MTQSPVHLEYNVQEHAGRPPLENHGARSLLLAPGRPDRLSGGVSGGVVAGVEVEVVVVVVEVEVEVLDEVEVQVVVVVV